MAMGVAWSVAISRWGHRLPQEIASLHISILPCHDSGACVSPKKPVIASGAAAAGMAMGVAWSVAISRWGHRLPHEIASLHTGNLPCHDSGACVSPKKPVIASGAAAAGMAMGLEWSVAISG
jgi:hypothetical protein